MDLKLQVLLQALDRVSAPLKRIRGAGKDAGVALRKTRDELRELERQQSQLEGFRRLKRQLDTSRTAMAAAQQQARQLRAAVAGGGPDADKQAAALKRVAAQSDKLKATYRGQLEQLRQMRAELTRAGVPAREFGGAEQRLRARIQATTASLEKQQAALRRNAAARDALAKRQALAAHLSVGGYGAMAVGERILGAAHPALEQSQRYQSQLAQMRAQGASQADIDAAQRFALADKTPGVSATDRLEIVKDANSILRNMHEATEVSETLAKAKYVMENLMKANGEGEGGGQQTINQLMDAVKTGELRNITQSPEKFKDFVEQMVRAYAGSGGLVKPSDYLEAMKTGGVAAKQMSQKAFFSGALNHVIQEMGGSRAGTGLASAYQNWAAGRSTQQTAEALAQLGLVNKDAVVYGKTGHITKMLPGALVNQQLYETNPFEYLMKEVIPRINPEGKLSDDEVVSKLNSLFSARKGGDLFASMYMQRDNIRKQLAASEKFASIDDAVAITSQTAEGQEAQLRAARDNLYREMGTQLLPMYVAGLRRLTGVLRALGGAAQRHPVIAKALGIVTVGLGGLLAVGGALSIGLGGLVNTGALLAQVLGKVPFGPLASVAGTVTRVLGSGLLGALRMVGTALLWVGRLALANPILAVIALIAAGALYIYRHWDQFAPYFQKAWSAVKDAALAVWDAIKSAFAAVVEWVSRKIDAAVEKYQQVKKLVSEVGNLQGGVAVQALAVAGNANASAETRNKARLVAGLAMGLKAINPFAGVGMDLGTKFVADQPVKAAPANVTHTSTYHITVPAPPGGDPRATARAVREELERRDRANAAQQRSALSDD